MIQAPLPLSATSEAPPLLSSSLAMEGRRRRRREGRSKEQPSWRNRTHVLTHLLTHPTTSPSLHSQLLVASLFPCFLDWDYPPFLCDPSSSFPPPLLRWSLSLFFRRASRFGLPRTSWRSTCPFQQPPPVVLAPAVGEVPATWGEVERRAWVRKRMRRGRLGVQVPVFVAVAVPNMLLLSLLFLDPLWLRPQAR